MNPLARASHEMGIIAAAIYHGARITKADGSFFEAHDFNRWEDEPVLTLEQAMKQWT